MLAVNLEFPHSYEVGEIPELPGTGNFSFPTYYFPRPAHSGQDGIWVMVRPLAGENWAGVFAFGEMGHSSFFTGAVSTPHPEFLIVVAHGTAYRVNANNADDWEELPAHPVRDVRLDSERQLVLLSTFTDIAAYGRDGLTWCSPRLCWDDLKIEKVTADTIEGTGYDPTNELGKMAFAVDIRTGKSLIAPPKALDGSTIW